MMMIREQTEPIGFAQDRLRRGISFDLLLYRGMWETRFLVALSHRSRASRNDVKGEESAAWQPPLLNGRQISLNESKKTSRDPSYYQ